MAVNRPVDRDAIRQYINDVVASLPVGWRSTEMGMGAQHLDVGRAYLSGLAPAGLVVPSWPKAVGGCDADPAAAADIGAIRSSLPGPDLYPFNIGLFIAGETLLEFGTTAQQERWLWPIATGDEIWCQMFSEPDAGSDLANVSLRARKAGDAWRLDGRKVWISRAAWASWGLLLARTDPDLPKHQGLTMFAVDMGAVGLEHRPLRQMNGDAHFSEVFATDVLVEDDQRIGDVGEGWRVAMAALSHERRLSRRARMATFDSTPPPVPTAIQDGLRSDSAVLRQRAARVFCLWRIGQLDALRLAAADADRSPLGSLAKLTRSRLFKAHAGLEAELAGAQSMLWDGPGTERLLTSPSLSIRGGTDEIQRTIIGERILGLAPDVRVDREVPWRLSRRGVART